MAGVGGVGGPSLSEIQAWDVAHLESAATDWKATAEHWESSFSSIHRVTVSPGGTVWEGVAAEAAQERAFADLVKVRGLADVLHESAQIARRGAETLDSAKRSVLDAVEEASSAGYVVGEDLSVTPPRASVAAQAQAQVYAADLQQRAAQLVAHDAEIAAKITTASAPLSAVTFAESQAPAMVRALGAGFKLDHEWDPYTDQPAHGPFEPVQPGPTQFDPKTGTVQGGGGPIGGKGGSGAGGKGGSGGTGGTGGSGGTGGTGGSGGTGGTGGSGGVEPPKGGAGGGEIPKNVRDTLEQIDAGKWPGAANTPGTKGGGKFENKEGFLPATDASGKPIIYTKWDVNPKGDGARDAERIVTGTDGSAWYTDGHYGLFKRIR
ncbi:ribonuclease domain-containing protein [Mycobacterium sp. pR1184]|uniref:ribonuclease domain-containing protein n=1 Tax=Mycobacterium sp. pR1184 TaxID=3238981 RepID=UPI00351B3C0F